MFQIEQQKSKNVGPGQRNENNNKGSGGHYYNIINEQNKAFTNQNMPAQMMVEEEEEKAVQRKTIQKQGNPEEEEEPIQGKTIQKQGKPEEEELVQEKAKGNVKSQQKNSSTSPGMAGSLTGMPEPVRDKMENSFGTDFSNVNIYANDQNAVHMGALAYTQGNDVHFAPGQYSPSSQKGQELLGHELTHILQQRQGQVKPTKQGKGMAVNDSPALEKEADEMGKRAADGKVSKYSAVGNGNNDSTVQMREATWMEKRAWLSFFSHYLPRKFLNNYMDDKAAPIKLTEQEMKDCNPVVSVMRSPQIRSKIQELANKGGGSASINTTGWGGALTNGTLGNFRIHYQGVVNVKADGSWAFQGTMKFTDFWDFDPKKFGTSGRSTAGELKTRFAATFLPGSPFDIDSETVPVSQTNLQQVASWGANFTPVHVGDNAQRTALDIDVGATVGAPSLVGMDIGAEFGAQSSEDLNKK